MSQDDERPHPTLNVDAVPPIVELPPSTSNKFGIAWPEGSPGSGSTTFPFGEAILRTPERGISDTEYFVTQDSESGEGTDNTPVNELPRNEASGPAPRLSRAFSMPLPSQLGHLKHPRKLWPEAEDHVLPTPDTTAGLSQLKELSSELADSLQMMIQTLLQVSPPQLLDSSKEQFSSCSLAIPSPSISAILTTMKNLNYMSANLSALGSHSQNTGADSDPDGTPVLDDFDIGEILQSVGDSLSGVASQAGVDLVLFHADVGMKHVSVQGDECGMSYALSHVVRQVLETAQVGDTIEIGLHTSPVSDPQSSDPDETESIHSLRPPSPSPSSSSSNMLPESGRPIRCTFDIAHKFLLGEQIEDPSIDDRPRPNLHSKMLQRILRLIGATIKTDLKPRLFSHGRSCTISIILNPGSPSVFSRPTPESPDGSRPFSNANLTLSDEPSLEELVEFIDSLKGKRVALHASAEGSFAHHLSSYLTAWGLDVNHLTTVPGEESMVDPVDVLQAPMDSSASPSTASSPLVIPSVTSPENTPDPLKAAARPPAFIVIDDDVPALRTRLLQLQLRTEQPYKLHLGPRQRPSLASNHRPRSTPHVMRPRPLPQITSPPAPPPPVIVHFTSLSNYKRVKDVLQSVLSMSGSSNTIPEVIVVPKPAGPRRFLTALRTAVVKPIVDPYFSPIATSPISPSIYGLNAYSPFFSNTTSSRKSPRPSLSPRTQSDRSTRSKDTSDGHSHPPLPSPLGRSDNMEYFSEATVRLGPSPASGMVISSPDGSPAGIFFHPRAAAQKSSEQGNLEGVIVKPPGSAAREDASMRLPHDRASDKRRTSDPLRRQSGGVEVIPGSPRPLMARHRASMSFNSAVDSVAEEPSEESEASPPSRPGMGPHMSNVSRGRLPTSSRPDDRPGLGVRISPKISPTQPTAQVPTAEALPPAGRVSTRQSTLDNLLRRASSPPVSPRGGGPPVPVPGRRSIRRTTPTGELPGLMSPSAGATKPRGVAADGHIVPPIKVLIVEDNPINQTILSTFMRKKKIKYDVAGNGAEAVAKWKSGGFHFILMDIQMPVMDGIEATKEIRRLEQLTANSDYPITPGTEGQNTPSEAGSTDSRTSATTPFRTSVIIVALTASSLQSDRVAALAAGCNDFLTKPVSLMWLNNKIIEWGSIKALQMWADLRPDIVKKMTSEQVAQANDVASKLHVPENRKPSPIGNRSPSASASNVSETESSTPSGIPLDAAPNPKISQLRLGAFPETSSPLDDESLIHSGVTSLDSLIVSSRTALINEQGARHQSSTDSDKTIIAQPSSLPQISGEDALVAHLKEVEEQRATSENGPQPILLGERTLSSEFTSIAEILHSNPPSGPTTPHTSSSTQQLAHEDNA